MSVRALRLMKFYLLEEYRFHVAFSSRLGFWAFPLLSLAAVFMAVASRPSIVDAVGESRYAFSFVLAMLMYGFSTGGFEFMGRDAVSRRRGRENFIVATPTFLPLDFSQTLLGVYVRDLLYYQALVLAPVLAGGLLALPLSDMSLSSFVLLFAAMEAAFVLGLSLSFALAVSYSRSPWLFLTYLACVVAWPFAMRSVGQSAVLPPYAIVTSGSVVDTAAAFCLVLLASLLLVLLAFVSVPRELTATAGRAKGNLYTGWLGGAGGADPLLRKELVELWRSWAVLKMAMSFTVPLLFLAVSIWYLNYGIGLLPENQRFGTVFYAGMVGFFGVLIYSWLVALSPHDYLNALPVTVPEVIRSKLKAFIIMTVGISTAFLAVVAVMNDELGALVLAWPLMLLASVYSVTMTAYLTGLRTNSLLFDLPTLAKWSAMSSLPGAGIAIVSFSVYSSPFAATAAIMAIMAVMAIATYLFYRGIDSKWGSASF